MSAFAGVFDAFPNTSFSQNVGLISFTGVASRYVVALCGGMLVVLGVGVEVRPDVLSSLPEEVQLLAGSGLIAGGVTAVVLNVVLPAADDLDTRDRDPTVVSADGGQE